MEKERDGQRDGDGGAYPEPSRDPDPHGPGTASREPSRGTRTETSRCSRIARTDPSGVRTATGSIAETLNPPPPTGPPPPVFPAHPGSPAAPGAAVPAGMVAPALLALALGALGVVADVPVPLLDITNTTMAGTKLRGLCSLPAGAPKGILVRVLVTGRGDQGTFTKPPVPFSLLVREEDAETGLQVTCEAWMAPDTPRSKSQRIHVLVKPRLDTELCPPQQNWTEGQEGILTCSAKGAPEPQVSCSKDGNALAPGPVRPATRAHARTYLCRATNRLGTAERNVTVWVQYNAAVPLLLVLLGMLLPVTFILSLAILVWYLQHIQKISEYRLWKRRRPPPDAQPPRPQGGSAAAPNGSAAP